MMTVTLSTGGIEKNLSEYAKSQLPYATAQAMNRVMFFTKKHIERQMDKYYDGGAVAHTKRGVQYKKARKELLVGFVYIDTANNRDYIMTTIDGGEVVPKNKVLTKPMNLTRLAKGNNIPNKYVAKRYNDEKFFVGVPKQFNRGGGKTPIDHPYSGLWERIGPKGKRGGIARKNIIMRVKFGGERFQKGFFPARKIAKADAIKSWPKILGQELAKAVRGPKPRLRSR
jgi:hypothetical protein